MLHEALIAIALAAGVGSLTAHEGAHGVLALALSLTFTSFVLWLKGQPRVEPPEIRGLRSELNHLREEHDTLKSKLDGLILGGRRGH